MDHQVLLLLEMILTSVIKTLLEKQKKSPLLTELMIKIPLKSHKIAVLLSKNLPKLLFSPKQSFKINSQQNSIKLIKMGILWTGTINTYFHHQIQLYLSHKNRFSQWKKVVSLK